MFGSKPRPPIVCLVAGALLSTAHVPALAADAGAPPSPRPLQVPAALRRRLPRIEASGLAWSAALHRYLVVIDDTIDETKHERRAPILLTLDSDGRLDEQPLVIADLEALDDAESICAAGRVAAAERFLVLTSHAPNRHGRLRSARRQLVELRLEGGRLRAAARVDLTAGPGSVPMALGGLGIAAPRGIDAEAVAWRDGAVYVGLKTPLDAQGAALLLRLGSWDEVFAPGGLPTGAVRVARRVSLRSGGAAEGFADLVFDARGGMLLAANAPKGEPTDGGGALWSVPADGATPSAARRLAQFPGLRPEGVAWAPDQRGVVVLFDRGDAEPWWVTWPLPN